MGKSHIQNLERLWWKYQNQTIQLSEGKEVKFDNELDLKTFLASYFIMKYNEELIRRKPKAMRDEKEKEIWNRQVNEIMPIYEAFETSIWNFFNMAKNQKKDRTFGPLEVIDYNEVILNAKSIWEHPQKVMEERLLPIHSCSEVYVVKIEENSLKRLCS